VKRGGATAGANGVVGPADALDLAEVRAAGALMLLVTEPGSPRSVDEIHHSPVGGRLSRFRGVPSTGRGQTGVVRGAGLGWDIPAVCPGESGFGSGPAQPGAASGAAEQARRLKLI